MATPEKIETPSNRKDDAAVDPDQLEDLKNTITVDTVHGDEAVKVLASYDGDQVWTEQEEKKLVRKIDRRLLSIMVTTYGLQYYDKAMLAQAALFGLVEDLQLDVGISTLIFTQ